MTFSTTRKNISVPRIGLYGITALILSLSVIAIGNIGSVSATTTVTDNSSVSCGPSHWGLKEAVETLSSEGTAGTGSFTDSNGNCVHEGTYQSRDNAAKLQVELNSNAETYDFAWNALIQGEDPWGISDTDAGANSHNSDFDNLNSDQSTDYYLKTQWVWTNIQKPNSGDDVVVNYLADLWLKDDANTYLVIDFLVDRVKSSGSNWVQESVSDASAWPFGASGTQYYEPFCNVVDGKTIYHFNVVLDNTSNESAGSWYEVDTNIDDEIDWALDYSGYDNPDSESTCSSDPGTRSDFDKIIDIEAGIEMQAQEDIVGTSAAEGGFSWLELYY